MKKIPISLIFVLGCAGACSPFARAQEVAPATAATSDVAAVAAPMSAAQILEKSRQTYAAFSSYKGSCSAVSDVLIAVGDAAPVQNVSSASAQIEFVRDKYLSLDGVDMGGSPFKALWTPGAAYIEQVRPGATIAAAGTLVRTDYKDKQGATNERAVDSMVAGLTGFTGTAASMIPAALRDDFWSNPFPNPKSQLALLPARDLGATPCYVVVATDAQLNSVNTYWIEQKTFLLRRLTQEQGEQTYNDLPERKGVKQPVMRLAYSLNQLVFATTEAK